MNLRQKISSSISTATIAALAVGATCRSHGEDTPYEKLPDDLVKACQIIRELRSDYGCTVFYSVSAICALLDQAAAEPRDYLEIAETLDLYAEEGDRRDAEDDAEDCGFHGCESGRVVGH